MLPVEFILASLSFLSVIDPEIFSIPCQSPLLLPLFWLSSWITAGSIIMSSWAWNLIMKPRSCFLFHCRCSLTLSSFSWPSLFVSILSEGKRLLDEWCRLPAVFLTWSLSSPLLIFLLEDCRSRRHNAVMRETSDEYHLLITSDHGRRKRLSHLMTVIRLESWHTVSLVP